MIAAKIDVDEVLDRIEPGRVLDAFGIQGKQRGRVYRLPICPGCGHKSSRGGISVYMYRGRWRWSHYGSPCHGDLIDMIAIQRGLDRRRDWPALIAIGAELAGVDARELTEGEKRDRAAQRAAREAAQRAADDAERDRRRREASSDWPKLLREHPAGKAYLRQRGLLPEWLIAQDLVRFGRHGDVVVKLFDVGGELATLPRRVIDPRDERKVLIPLGGTQRGTMLSSLRAITPWGRCDYVLTEGLIDSLTAAQLWTGRVVFGAGGAGQMRTVADHVGRLIRRAGRGRLWIVPDTDGPGERARDEAVRAAREAGLSPGFDLHVVDVRPHRDLNAALVAGWKP